ncbi:MAG: Nramp family divalent metal transporter [Prolixibacteraceae bacterium]|jgi:Mn2+/Fe2+ NRAMP family transporter|nr:Nramp family divalent metal transporter [Prolixibacteraceae bacterium]
MKSNLWKAIGPGIIWAGAAIGVSHLVQSTRAGADYGFQLILIVLLANVLKYPFFQFGPRYAIATGESLIDGYKRMGKWVVLLFLLLTTGTMFSILAAVSSVTVGVITSVIPIPLSYTQVAILLLLVCSVIVLIGKYRALDRIMKYVVVVLGVSTIAGLIIAFTHNTAPVQSYLKPLEWGVTDVAFVIALVGWMPSAIDISVWNSLWTLAKIKESGYKPKLKETMIDFNIGYIGTVVLSLSFLGLGALVMYGSGESFANNGTQFANQFFSLYTSSIGSWAYVIIAVAAIATMFSTTLTVLDAYPRVLNPIVDVFSKKSNNEKTHQKLNYLWTAILIIGAVLIITVLSGKMRMLVDIATTLSFITAPVLGYLNLRVMTAPHVDKKYRPKMPLRILSWIAIVVFSLFSVYYLFVY